jgi:hypothetical protein
MASQPPLLVDTGRGLTIRYREKLLYSSVDPRGAALRRARRIPRSEKTLVFIPSLGLGYGLAELLERLPAGSHVLCVETNQELMRLGCSAAVLPRDERLTVIRSGSAEAVARVLQELGAWRFRRVSPLYLCRAYELDKETYAEMLTVLESGIRAWWQNRLTLNRMARLWIRNLFTNLHLLSGPDAPPAADLSELRTEKALLLAGAGPSLEDSLEWIGQRRAGLFVIAVDTALPVLLDAGIRPDAVFVLEAQLANLQDFLAHPGLRLPLICDLTSNPWIIRRFGGQGLYFFSSCFYPLKLFERLRTRGLLPAQLPPLGSVGVAAAEAALGITPGPLLLAGLDFSYPEGKTHARGAPFHRAMLHATCRYNPVDMPGYEAIQNRPLLRLRNGSGHMVLSDLVLQGYALKLREIIASSDRVFALSERGLPSGAPLLRVGQANGPAARIPTAAAAVRSSLPASTFTPTRKAVAEFLDSEEKLLDAATAACRGARSGSRQPGGAGRSLRETLRQVEYAYLDLPDFTPELRLSGDLLARVAGAVADTRRRLKELRRQS